MALNGLNESSHRQMNRQTKKYKHFEFFNFIQALKTRNKTENSPSAILNNNMECIWNLSRALVEELLTMFMQFSVMNQIPPKTFKK